MGAAGLPPEEGAHLDRARVLARRGWGSVHPNPLVGCVIVRDGRIVGEGYHAVFGGPHAEVAALGEAGELARGSTAFVSLEPCSHHGKTPPCAQALIDAGVARVVFGATDPGAVSGGGADMLRAAGVDVRGPAWPEAEGRAENAAFFHVTAAGAPFVALKLAMSLDGAIAARPGERTPVSGAEAELEVHRLRSGFDAVMVGAGTARIDDPRLTPRRVPVHDSGPSRIVLDPRGTLPRDAALYDDVPDAPLHVFVGANAPGAATERMKGSGAHVHGVGASKAGLDLGDVLATCWEMGLRTILCEGGARLADSLLREQRVHRLYLFIAPTTFGAQAVRAFPEEAEALGWDRFRPAYPPELHGNDTLIVLDRQEA